MVKVWLAPLSTLTVPVGVIEPPLPAEATIVLGAAIGVGVGVGVGVEVGVGVGIGTVVVCGTYASMKACPMLFGE